MELFSLHPVLLLQFFFFLHLCALIVEQISWLSQKWFCLSDCNIKSRNQNTDKILLISMMSDDNQYICHYYVAFLTHFCFGEQLITKLSLFSDAASNFHAGV